MFSKSLMVDGLILIVKSLCLRDVLGVERLK